jgi:hypothetical protein
MVLGLLAASPAAAQLPLLQPSFGAGIAVPVRGEADRYGSGLHLRAALKLPILPLQVEGALVRMGAEADADEDLTIWSGGVAVPLRLTPPLLPVGVYVVAGGGLHRSDAETTSTDFGLSGGAGVSLGLGLSLFAEGRGVLVFADNKLTYLTAAVGLRF